MRGSRGDSAVDFATRGCFVKKPSVQLAAAAVSLGIWTKDHNLLECSVDELRGASCGQHPLFPLNSSRFGSISVCSLGLTGGLLAERMRGSESQRRWLMRTTWKLAKTNLFTPDFVSPVRGADGSRGVHTTKSSGRKELLLHFELDLPCTRPSEDGCSPPVRLDPANRGSARLNAELRALTLPARGISLLHVVQQTHPTWTSNQPLK